MTVKMTITSDHDHGEHLLHLDATDARAGAAPGMAMNMSVLQNLLGPVTCRTSG